MTLVSVRTEPATNWSVGDDEAEDAGLVGVEAVIRTSPEVQWKTERG